MNRNEIAAELLRGCPAESLAIAAALRRGDAAEAILAMPEVNHWPETYVWLKAELTILAAAATLGRKGGQAKSQAKAAASRSNGAKGGRPRRTE